MCSKQKIRKIAWCLLLVALISLIPSKTFRVLADETIVPPFPYDELQTIGENDYVLFKVHGVEQVDYIEVLMPRINVHGNYQHLCPGLSYSNLGGWVLQINSIDYYFKDGQSIYFDLQSLFTTSFMPVENDDNYFPAWLEFVYTTEEIWGIDEDSNQGRGLKWFKDQNFIIPPAATPTPTPEPTITPVQSWSSYPDLPANFSSQTLAILKYHSSNINDGQLIGIASSYIGGSASYSYPTFYKDRKPYNYNSQAFCNNAITINTWSNSYLFSVFTVNYDDSTGVYSVGSNLYSSSSSAPTGWYLNAAYWWRGETLACWSVVPYGQLTIHNSDSASFDFDDSYFEILFTNKNYIPGSSDNPYVSPTVTPTSAPTPIPQPSTTPDPEDPDKNSSWGWGIVNALKYIFIPDKNKLIRLEKTTQTKFQQFGGGYDDLKHVSGFEDPVRPQNVIMNWKPFGSDSSGQQQQITLVDFEQIDFYLFKTSSGMFICDCLKASFTFLMFGYLIHVIRKHFVIENTSSDDSSEGGD